MSPEVAVLLHPAPLAPMNLNSAKLQNGIYDKPVIVPTDIIISM
jgi:hypothetical protein